MEVNDLCTLESLDEQTVIETLKSRYEVEKVYTWIGDILLFLNPFKSVDTFTKQNSEQKEDLIEDRSFTYAVSKQIYDALTTSSECQCFIVSGESGSGKTAVTTSVLDHFLSQCITEDRKLIERIQNIGVILDAFGSAKTTLNDNATRHGKYLQLDFSPTGRLISASITECLLEKSRVAYQKKDEQNFHVFYYLFSGRSGEELSRHLLDLPTQHRYLKYGEAFGNHELKWSNHYKSLLCALQLFNFSEGEISAVFGILSAILNIGDIRFNLQDEKTGAYIENSEVVDKVAILLGIDSGDLEVCLTSNYASIRDDTLSSFKNINEASSCRDGFARGLYARLFGWLVHKVNTCMENLEFKKRKSECLTVGLLDIFGFENSPSNSFEQLCINVANEQLQLHFTQHMFALENVEYLENELDIKPLDYTDNKELINLLLEQPHGIFTLLEEESKCIQADDNLLVSSFNAHCSDHKNYVASSSKVPMFSIVHFTRKVQYVVDGFLEKNIDKLDGSLVDCLKGSNDVIISTLFTSLISRTGSLIIKNGTGKCYCCHEDLRKSFEKSKKQRKDRGYNTNKASRMKRQNKKSSTAKKGKPSQMLGSILRNSLVDLMEKILVCQAHFVRCVKANKEGKIKTFDDSYVNEQLKYLGVLETIKIRKIGYPVRLLFKTFLDRYRFLMFDSTTIEFSEENCKLLLDKFKIDGCQLGKTKVFMKLSHEEILTEELRKVTSKVITAQKMVRGHLARVDYEFLKNNRKQEERNVGNLLVSIASKGNKMHENLIILNDADTKRHQKIREKEMHKSEYDKENQQKRKLNKNSSEGDIKNDTLKSKNVDSPNRKVPRSKTRTEPIIRNFTATSMSAWCRVDCYERQFHMASFHMDQAVICVDGTHPFSDKNRIAFAAIPTRSDDPKVSKVKSCIGKGVQLHQDEKQNLWATRLGKNPIYVRGHTLCPELVKLNGKLTQGVPMKVLDTAAFREYMKGEVEASGGVDDDLKEKIISRLKVCMSFIKDTVVDEETPCWFEIWLLRVKENMIRYLDNYQKRRDHEEKRRSGHFNAINAVTPTPTKPRDAPEIRRAKSGDQLKHSERRPRSHTTLATTSTDKNSRIPRPRPPSQQIVQQQAPSIEKQQSQPSMEKALSRLKSMNPENVHRKITQEELRREKSMEIIRREKSMDVRMESRLLMEREYRNSMYRSSDKQITKKMKKGSPSQSPEQSLARTSNPGSRQNINGDSTMESVNSRLMNGNNNASSPVEYNNRGSYANAPKECMSYRQVFGLQSSDYLFNVTPPNYTRHRRFSDSDTESLQNFVHRIIPQDDKNKVLQNIQPKKWLKKARRKSEDNPKKKLVAQLSNK